MPSGLAAEAENLNDCEKEETSGSPLGSQSAKGTRDEWCTILVKASECQNKISKASIDL
jgi:hypothetical protein